MKMQRGTPGGKRGRAKRWFSKAPAHVTPRELDVLRCIADGLDAGVIAVQLCITRGTVNHHAINMRRNLYALTNAHAVHIAHSLGIL